MHTLRKNLSRRDFMAGTGATAGALAIGGATIAQSAGAEERPDGRMRVALVGTGVRGVRMYGRDLLRGYSNFIKMVGICDINPGRLEYAHEYIGADCPKFVHLDEMLAATKPEWLIVTSWDREHHNNILTGLEHGCNIICEKPITVDEKKAQAILDAEQRSGKKVIVTFNHRYPPHRARLKEMLMGGVIGDITTVDFHWNIHHGHLQQYMQRWHGENDKSQTLWVHKCTHHFDLVNWWLDSDPVEVHAYAALERFGPQGPFRGRNCRDCEYTEDCDYYWDITRNEHLRRLYTENEHYDGYIRDNCVFRKDTNIYNKQSALVKYANNVYLNYSLTGDTDHAGFWIAFNGTKGRIEGREGGWPSNREYHDWILTPRGRDAEVVRVPFEEGGHWGGDFVMLNRLFRDPDAPDPLHQAAGTRHPGRRDVDAGGRCRPQEHRNRPACPD